MCTVSWTRRPAGFDLLFNRDELRTRAPAAAPRLHPGDVAWVGPVDGDFGGTWIAANAAGIVLALLNGYRSADEPSGSASGPAPAFRSRGLLVTDLASARSLDAVESGIADQDLDRSRSFRLVALAPDVPARLFEWDRRTLTVDRDADSRLPVVSSSFDESAVGAARRAEWTRVTGRALGAPLAPDDPPLDTLLAYHRSTHGGPSAFTVAMDRPEAATRSLTRVTVTPDDVVMRYAPGPPRRGAEETDLRLLRIRVP